MSDLIYMSVQGDEIYEHISLPQIPRKGDVLWLGSLTRGESKIPEVLVSKVEWAMEQSSGQLHLWITVRRINRKVKE